MDRRASLDEVGAMKEATSLTDSLIPKSRRFQRTPLVATITATTKSSALATEQGGESYSINALLNPSPQLLRGESQGRVTIYDGLDDHVVEQTLDSEFHRMYSMMFVNTRYQQPDGSVSEEDDCDCAGRAPGEAICSLVPVLEEGGT